MRLCRSLVAIAAAIATAGCSLWAFKNEKLVPQDSRPSCRATFDLKDPRGKEDALVLLALSGGGSRAAYFSSCVMSKLQEHGLLQQVDVISSVSGGSLAAAYYCITKDKDLDFSVKLAGGVDLRGGMEPRIRREIEKKIRIDAAGKTMALVRGARLSGDARTALIERLTDRKRDEDEIDRLYDYSNLHRNKPWEAAEVRRLMSCDFQMRWLARWFWPNNVAKYWFTSFDRSDMMADTLTANIFSPWNYLWHLKFKDLNPERPYLIINATNGTRGTASDNVFTFTREDFEGLLGSDIGNYPLPYAVTASAAFPAVFSYVTLKDYKQDDSYVNVFDGGNSDNLGVTSLIRILDKVDGEEPRRFSKVLFILVDSFCVNQGVSPADHDPRNFFIDLNFMATFDFLLARNREALLRRMQGRLDTMHGMKTAQLIFNFEFLKDDANLFAALNAIPTKLSISKEDRSTIERATDRLFALKRDELGKAMRLIEE